MGRFDRSIGVTLFTLMLLVGSANDLFEPAGPYARAMAAQTTDGPVSDAPTAQLPHGRVELTYPDGSRRAEAVYRHGLLHGTYRAFAENGRLVVQARFQDGLLDGRLERWSADGKRVEIARYEQGTIAGTRIVFRDGQEALRQTYENGEVTASEGDASADPGSFTVLLENKAEPGVARADTAPEADTGPDQGALRPPGYPYALNELKRAAQRINELQIEGAQIEEQAAAVRRLILHRLVCGVPEFMLKHDPADGELAERASEVCHVLGRLEHFPPNPGLPEDIYKKGYEGASKSNLAVDHNGARHVIDQWMIDPGEPNRDEVAHRRWCLAPGLFEVGYGAFENTHALLVTSNYDRDATFDLITYPGRGYMPIDMFTAQTIWSIHPDTRQYTLPASTDQLRVEVFKISRNREPEAVEIARVHLSSVDPVLRGILFEPQIPETRDGDVYEVRVQGLRHSRNDSPFPLIYRVHFVDLGP